MWIQDFLIRPLPCDSFDSRVKNEIISVHMQKGILLGAPSTAKKLLQEVCAISALVAYWVFVCREIFAHFFSRPYSIGIFVDGVGQQWMSWWIQQAIRTPDFLLFHCPLINYPLGAQVLTYDVAYFHLALSGFLRPILGPYGATNAVFVGAILFGLLAMYGLTRILTESRFIAALFSSLIFPYAFWFGFGFVDIELADLGFLALATATWILATRTGKIRWVIVAGMFTGLTCLAQMYYGINMILFLIFAALFSFWGGQPEGQSSRQSALFSLIIAVVGILMTVPAMLPAIKTLGAVGLVKALPVFPKFNPTASTNSVMLLALPAGALILLILFFAGWKNRSFRFWVFSSGLFCILAAGTHFKIPGTDFYGPLPFYFLKRFVPFFWRYNFTDRFGRMAIVLLVVICVLLLRIVQRRFKLEGKTYLGAVLLIFVAGHFIAPLMVGIGPKPLAWLTPVAVADPYVVPTPVEKMGKDPEQYVVFDLFCGNQVEFSALYQLFHQKPIAGDPLRPDGISGGVESDLTKRKNKYCAAIRDGYRPVNTPRAWFEQNNVRYIIVPADYMARMNEKSDGHWVLVDDGPVYADFEVMIYDLWAQQENQGEAVSDTANALTK